MVCVVYLPFDETAFTNKLAALDELRQQLDAQPLAIQWRGQLARDLIASAVQASTHMEGVPVTVQEVRRILAGDRPENVSVEDAALVTGYRDAMRYCQRRADDDVFEWSPELIKAIQDHILAGRRDLGAGRYGKGRYVTNSKTGELIYTPPQENVDQLVNQMCARMNTWSRTTHPALASAWVHVALAAIHPFTDGNGRTARVLASLAMYRGGFKRAEFTSLEEWWGRHVDNYYAAFTCLGPEWNPKSDVTPFIETHLAAQVSQVYAAQMTQLTVSRVFEGLLALTRDLQLNGRTVVALWDAFNGRPITRPYYISTVNIKEATASAELRTMTGFGLLRPEGRTRGRRWVAGPEFWTRIGRVFNLEPEASNHDSIVTLLSKSVIPLTPEPANLRLTTFAPSIVIQPAPVGAGTSVQTAQVSVGGSTTTSVGTQSTVVLGKPSPADNGTK